MLSHTYKEAHFPSYREAGSSWDLLRMTAGIFCMPAREEREQKRHPSLYAIVLTIGCPTKIVLLHTEGKMKE